MQYDLPVRYIFTSVFFITCSILVAIMLYNYFGALKLSYIIVSLSGGGVPGLLMGAYIDTRIAYWEIRQKQNKEGDNNGEEQLND